MRNARPASVALFAILILVLSACVPVPQQQPAPAPAPVPAGPTPGGSLTVRIGGDPASGLDPYQTPEGATEEIAANVFEGLLSHDDKGGLKPGLAERWEMSADGKTFTFYLKKGVLFHNGKEMKAEDVVDSFAKITEVKDGKTVHPRARDYPVATVEPKDDYTVVITLKQPSGAFLSNLAVVAAGIQPKGVDKAAQKTSPVGTGPFKFAEWVPNQHIKLVKWEKYHQQGLPYLDEVTFKVIQDSSAALAALKTGAVDVTGVEGAMVKEVQNDKNLKLVTGLQNLVQILALNNKAAPLDNVTVRRAVHHALDRGSIIQGAVEGHGTPIGSHMSPALGAYYVDLTGLYPYDPAKAKALLAEANLSGGFDVQMTLPGLYPVHQRTGEIIADQLGKVGIRAKLEVQEWGKWLSDTYQGRKYGMTVIGHTGRLDPDAILNRFVKGASGNYMQYENPKADQLIKEGVATFDLEKRRQIYIDLQKLILEDAASYWIADLHRTIGTGAKVQGWKIYPVYIHAVKDVWKQK